MTSDRLRTRVLIVNCYFPASRESIKLPFEVPNALAPVLLAGQLNPATCEIALYNEVSHGHLEIYGRSWLGWPDLVVLTGLTCAFDRLLQLTAYFRAERSKVIVVAGGLAVRALPRYSRRFFDYVCTGDVEELGPVVRDAIGTNAVAEVARPRYDLAEWIGPRIGYAESSRNCNFRCSFCSVTAAGYGYHKLSLEHFRRQLEAMGRRDFVLFMDNQFHAHDREFLLARLEIIRELRASGRFGEWAAFVTDTFFWDPENVERASEAGCKLLWVGVESFDPTWLARVNKSQNSRHSQVELAARCQDAGILFQYALVFDPSERTLAEMQNELDVICDDARIPLPNVIFMAFPVPGTPFFADRASRGLILPNTHVRDLEGSTLSLKPLDPVDDVARFVSKGKFLHGRRLRAVRHQAAMLARYRRSLGPTDAAISSITVASLLAPNVTSNPWLALRSLAGARSHAPRTFVSTSERLDSVYRPAFHLPARFAAYFEPTPITDAGGDLPTALADDLLDTRYVTRTRATARNVQTA